MASIYFGSGTFFGAKQYVTINVGSAFNLAILDSCMQMSDTALIKAAKNNHVTVVELLIESGANLECTDKVKRFHTED